MQQEPLEEHLAWAVLSSSILNSSSPPPSLPPQLTEEARKAQHPEVAFLFTHPHLIVVTPWAHFVLHLIPFERGHWRIAGEAGERSGGSSRRGRKAHKQQQQQKTQHHKVKSHQQQRACDRDAF